MKVFISWSGDISLKVAQQLREWLPCVINSIEPYVSSEDIDKGARWSTDIATELEDSTFGILCVTKDNLEAPWLSFEAGALSKTMEKSFVTPFLFDIKATPNNTIKNRYAAKSAYLFHITSARAHFIKPTSFSCQQDKDSPMQI